MNKRCVVQIKSKEENIKVQKELFRRGYGWGTEGKNISYLVNNYTKYYLFFGGEKRNIAFSVGLFNPDFYELIPIDKIINKQMEFDYENL